MKDIFEVKQAATLEGYHEDESDFDPEDFIICIKDCDDIAVYHGFYTLENAQDHIKWLTLPEVPLEILPEFSHKDICDSLILIAKGEASHNTYYLDLMAEVFNFDYRAHGFETMGHCHCVFVSLLYKYCESENVEDFVDALDVYLEVDELLPEDDFRVYD